MRGHILFRLTDDRLIAANTGRPFTYKGLVAIVYGWTSSKGPEPGSGMAADPYFESEITAREAVHDLFAKKKSHLSDPHQLASDRGQRAQTVQGYAERAILELLQNAVDANREIPIGYKGVGFRSVLNLTDSPEIHSGHLQVRWSPEIARRALGMDESPDPVLAFPEWCPPPSKIPTGYDTVIILPLSDQGARDHLKKEWDRVSIDPSLLVFIDGVQKLMWDAGDGQPKIWSREENDRWVTITEAVGDRSPIRHRWKLHQSGDAKVAVPVDDAGNFMVPRNVPRPVLRCFFPTEDPNPFANVLVHAPFALDNSRKHVDTADGRIEVHLTAIAAAFADAVSAMRVSEILDMLDHNTAIDDAPRDQLDARLSKRVKDEVLKQPLSALSGQLIATLRCCPQQEELPYRWRDVKRIERWEHFKSCLAEHRAGGMSDLPVPPSGNENPKRERTLLWLNSGAGLSKTELQQLPWAPVEGDSVPLASSVTPLFEAPGEGSEQVWIPAGIAMHFLDRKFRKALSERLGGDFATPFIFEVLGVRPFKLLDVVEHALLPVLESGNQPGGVVEFLFLLWRRSEEKKKTPKPKFDWKDARRARLIRAIRVKCRNGEERPALEVYAGRDWTSSDFLERCYGCRDDRTFLHPPPTDENGRVDWESFYRWLGIGWSPKVIPIIAEEDAKETRRGLDWTGERFGVASIEPKSWNEYCKDSWVKHLTGRELLGRRARLKLDWTIDGDRDVLAILGAFEVIRSEWGCYSSYKESICYCSNNLRRDGDDWRLTANSYLFWLFRNSTWIPARNSSELCSPRDVFLPGEVSHSDRMQGWAFAVGAEVSDAVASALGMRRDWIDVADDDWKRWLASARSRRPQEKNLDDREAIRRLYACLLENAKVPDGGAPRFSKTEVWWVERLEDRENWKLADVISAGGSYLDHPELERLRLENVWAFPARLDGKEGKAERLFGMPPLSRLLRRTPQFEGEQPFEDMQRRIRERMSYLLAYLGLDRNEQGRACIRAAIESVRVLEVNHLEVRCSMRGREIASLRESSFAHKDVEGWRLYLVSNSAPPDAGPRWERLAETILLACGFRPTEKAANVRDILIHPEDRLREKLTGLGVAPETVADAMQEALGLRVTAEPRETIADPKQQTPVLLQSPDPKPARPSEPLNRNLETPTNGDRPEIPRPEGGGGRTKPRGSGQRPHPEEGLNAQEWLREKLYEDLKDSGWSVSPGEQAIEGDQGRTDIVITSPTGYQRLVEVKRIEGRKLFWSKLQIETAQKHPGSYFMALVEPLSGSEEYEVYCLWNPLAQLMGLSRNIRWTWKEQRSSSGISENWEPLEVAPACCADGYKAAVELTDEFLKDLDRGLEKLTRKIVGDS